jgi:hypothetical protein
MKNEELKKTVDELMEEVKDYDKFIHLFSNDDAVKTMAHIHELLGKINFCLKISELKEIGHPEDRPIHPRGKPCLVKVRPCGEKYKNKTYVGFLLGDAALSSAISIEDDKITCEWSFFNPAIYLPEFGDIVYGAESWWSEIESEAELKEITDMDIQNVWYVN